jgi:hypothetical protein
MTPKHAVAARYVGLPASGLAILYCCKVGTWTFRSLGKEELPTRESFHQEMKNYPIRAQFIRNPFYRIVSAFRYFAALNDRFWEENIWYPMSSEMREWLGHKSAYTFEDFVLGAFEYFPEDKHIAPQWNTHYGLANFLWPFEDIARGWQKLQDAVPGLPELPWENRSRERPVEVTQKSKEAIRAFYDDDYHWWEDVCSKAEFCTT